MATVDDLVASFGGGMHVGQEGYDLQALQEYLSQHIRLPDIPLQPSTSNATYRPIAPSRSTSSTRGKSLSTTSLPSFPFQHQHQPLPSPLAQTSAATGAYFLPPPAEPPHHHHHHHHHHAVARPSHLRRSSSYDTPSSPVASYSSFESDAFAPLWQEAAQQQAQDPWAKIRQQNLNPLPWGQGEKQVAGGSGGQAEVRAVPVDMDVDEDMDMDDVEDGIGEEGREEERVERGLGLGLGFDTARNPAAGQGPAQGLALGQGQGFGAAMQHVSSWGGFDASRGRRKE